MVVQTQAEAAVAIGKATDSLHGQKRAVDEVTAALERENAAQEKAISAQEKANDLKQRTIDLENKRLNRDSEGFALDDQGNRRTSVSLTERGGYEMGKSQGLTEEQALQIGRMFAANNGQMVDMMAVNKAIDGFALGNARERAAADEAKARADKGLDQRGNPLAMQSGSVPSGGQPASAVAPAPAPSGSTITHVFEIGGRSTSVSVASGGDSANLVSVINQLKLAKLSSNG